jgi:Cdc6-like AAA superfamily ATPase
MMPQLKTSRFFDRVDVFEKLDQLLGPATAGSFRSVALYGLAGVGKSTIVSTYVGRRYDEGVYDTVLWVRSEKPTLMRQSFSDIAMKLKLPGAEPQNHDENLLLVQEWFQTTG